MQGEQLVHKASGSVFSCLNFVRVLWEKYRCSAFAGLFYGVVLYSLLMSQQLTNTFDGLAIQNFYHADFAELSSGRWALAFIDRVLMGVHADPIVSVVALALFVVGFLLVLDLFNLKGKTECLLCLALFISSTTVSITLSYRYTSLGYGLACFLAISGIYAVVRIKRNGIAVGIGGVLLGLSISCYQAYAAVFFVIAVFYAIFQCKEVASVDGKPLSKAGSLYLLRVFFSLCVGALFYAVSLSLALKLSKVSLSDYNGIGQMSIRGVLTNLAGNVLKAYQYFIAYFFKDTLKINRLQSYGIFYVLLALLIGMIVVIAVKVWKKDKKRMPLLLIATAGIPLAANAYMLLASDKMELQMTAGLAMVVPLIMIVAFSFTREKPLAKMLCIALCVALTYGSSVQVWMDQEGMYEGQNACDTMITQVICDLREEGWLSPDYEYFFVGVPEENPLFEVSDVYYCANAYAQMGRFWVSGNCLQGAYKGVIKRMGIALPESNLVYEDIAGKIDVSGMPMFPFEGYIELLDGGVVVIKIAENNPYTGGCKYVY